MQIPIHLLVALPAEAKPLIRAFDLKRLQPDDSTPRYGRGSLTLALSGPGPQAADTAVRMLQRLHGDARCCWINLGIAGHAQLAAGACLLAEGVSDTLTGEYWALNPLRDLPATTIGPLRCVRETETEFGISAGYDMESAAIARALVGFGALSRLQILKVISDNPNQPNQRINGKMVNGLMEQHLPTLNTLIDRLQANA